MSMNVEKTLTTALKIATTLLAATYATVMMDTLWILMTCTLAMVHIIYSRVFMIHLTLNQPPTHKCVHSPHKQQYFIWRF